MLAFSNFLHSYGMSSWVMFQQAYLVDLNMKDDFKQIVLISVSSFAELGSRLLFGFLISKNWMQIYRWNQIACCAMASAIITYPFVTSFPVLVAFNCFVASVFSINVVTSMPNLKEFLGIDMAALGQGLMVIPMGLGVVSVQIGGVIRDITGSFVLAFYLSAIALIISAINFQAIGFLSKHDDLPCHAMFYCATNEEDEEEEGEEDEEMMEYLESCSNFELSTSFSSSRSYSRSESYNYGVPSVKSGQNFSDAVIDMLQETQRQK